MPWSIKPEMVSRRVQMGVDKHDVPINIGVDSRGRIKPDGYLKQCPRASVRCTLGRQSSRVGAQPRTRPGDCKRGQGKNDAE